MINKTTLPLCTFVSDYVASYFTLLRYFFVRAEFERCKIFVPIFFFVATWSCGTRGFLLSSFFCAFYPVRGRPDSGILWILRGGVTVDTLSVVAFEPTVYSIESDLYSRCSFIPSTICMTKVTKIDSIFTVLNILHGDTTALFTLSFYKL